MLPCLLMLNGLSVLPFETLFEEFYNKAIKKSLWNQNGNAKSHPVWCFILDTHLGGLFKSFNML